MSTLVLRGAEKFPMKSTVVCNGQFLAMRADSLRSIGGFVAVATHVLDDIELGRSFVDGGYRGAVIDGSAIASTRMYSTFAELRSGYGKSLNRAFGSLFGSIVAAIFMVATGVLPLLYALDGDLLAIAALTAIIATRIVSALSSRSRIRDSFLHPASVAIFIYLLYYSWSNRGKTQWKGRTV
jgi:cellulose synthase/poly-beta-1,6-N-acetylglucosamine synthase-like glycosyltransferase